MATPGAAKPTASASKLLDISGETIAVQAGDQLIYVHKYLISNSSEFFKNATKPEWRTDSRPIDLSDEEPRIFERYCQWLYSGTVAPARPEENSYKYLARMYVLGEKIIDLEFQNAVIGAMISRMRQSNTLPSLDVVMIIYDGTAEKSPARRLLVDGWAYAITSSWRSRVKLLEPAYKPFLNDVFLEILEKRVSPHTSGLKTWLSQSDSYYRKVIALKSGLAEQKGDEVNPELSGQDGMDMSEA